MIQRCFNISKLSTTNWIAFGIANFLILNSFQLCFCIKQIFQPGSFWLESDQKSYKANPLQWNCTNLASSWESTTMLSYQRSLSANMIESSMSLRAGLIKQKSKLHRIDNDKLLKSKWYVLFWIVTSKNIFQYNQYKLPLQNYLLFHWNGHFKPFPGGLMIQHCSKVFTFSFLWAI